MPPRACPAAGASLQQQRGSRCRLLTALGHDGIVFVVIVVVRLLLVVAFLLQGWFLGCILGMLVGWILRVGSGSGRLVQPGRIEQNWTIHGCRFGGCFRFKHVLFEFVKDSNGFRNIGDFHILGKGYGKAGTWSFVFFFSSFL